MTRRYVLILKGTMREVKAQLQFMSDKAGKLTIGELARLQEAHVERK